MHIWDVYFAGIVSIINHPGYSREGTEKPSLEDCARIADEMLVLRESRNLDAED